jgi:hypothetical protein
MGMLFNALSVVVVIGVATPFFLVVFLPLGKKKVRIVYNSINSFCLQNHTKVLPPVF